MATPVTLATSATGDGGKLADGGDGMLSATRPGTTDPARPGTADRPEQPALSDAVDDGADGSSARDGEPTQPALTSTTAETTQPTPAADPAATTQPTPPAANGTAGPANGEAGPGPDATQRLEPVGNNGPKSRPSKPASKESKGGPSLRHRRVAARPRVGTARRLRSPRPRIAPRTRAPGRVDLQWVGISVGPGRGHGAAFGGGCGRQADPDGAVHGGVRRRASGRPWDRGCSGGARCRRGRPGAGGRDGGRAWASGREWAEPGTAGVDPGRGAGDGARLHRQQGVWVERQGADAGGWVDHPR